MKIANHTSRRLKNSGFSLAEVAITSFLIIFFTALSADLALLIFACSVNDKACRDVVRACAQQTNAADSAAFAAAETKNHKTDGVFISPIRLVAVTYQDFAGTPPAGKTPYVQATTSVNVTLPLPLLFFGLSFTNNMSFSQTYTSPIIKTKYVLN